LSIGRKKYFILVGVATASALFISALIAASRTAVLALLVGLVAFVFVKMIKERRSILPVFVSVAVLSVLLVFAVYTFFDYLPTRMKIFLSLDFTGREFMETGGMAYG